MLNLLFPKKCILCRKILASNETDLCHCCRKHAPELKSAKRNIPFVAHWTALWYYKDAVRGSIRRFKFFHARNYADAYARCLAMKLQGRDLGTYDLVTWVPVHFLRKCKRGYDQSALLAKAIAAELGLPVLSTLKKIRHTPPQSGITDAARRRANVLGAFRAKNASAWTGKTILLIDDVVTTGATASECARILLTAGAKEVVLAAVAAADHKK